MIVTVRAIVAERLFHDIAPVAEKRYPGWLVEFATAYGDGRGWWMGAGVHLTDASDPDPPTLHTPLPVELDFGSDFTWNVDATVSPVRQPGLAFDGTTITLRGLLIAADANGLAVVRLGDTPIAISAYGEPPPVGTPVALRVRRLFLYPVDSHGSGGL